MTEIDTVIPAFTPSGVLPPFVGDSPARRGSMSPYQVGIEDVARRFAKSPARKTIFRGLLAYRKALRDIGLTQGFQWLDGSFVEDVESARMRPPGDIDVVTFVERPKEARDNAEWNLFQQEHLDLLIPATVKARYHCEAFLMDLQSPGSLLVDDTRYWFGLFSHQRNSYHWKGMLQVGLVDDDAAALAVLGTGGSDEKAGT
ncbi:hypothetical protein KZ686_21615 [Cupriavidus cauae]|jgi:hypothetical protein|uniref:DUF6932 family protein n=1 Tax=Cupriavidus cauae TaxID=2608999 RepID=UPI002243CAEF|nr:hypothetical protein [Cupriavidus cauae]UZN50988.1 hypothetical protein KZ686_21615 [Cupriavidus cauae]